MKNLLFHVRRSSILQTVILLLLSGMFALVCFAGIAVRILLHYGLEDPDAKSFYFENWLYELQEFYGKDADSIRNFFMKLQDAAQSVMQDSRPFFWFVTVIGVSMFVMLIYLLVSAGYHGEKREPHLMGLEKIPYDLFLLLYLFSVYPLIYLESTIMANTCIMTEIMTCGILLMSLDFFLILCFIMITTAKMRTNTLIRGTVIAHFFRLIRYALHNLPFIWKGTLLWGGSLLFCIMLTIYYAQTTYYWGRSILISLLYPLLMSLLFFGGIWFLIQMNFIRKKAQGLAEGQLDEEDDGEKGFLFPFVRECLDNLSRISEGMNAAVNEKMKSERFQTELITNVSHDIKTPLTSIINYLDFLSNEERKEQPDQAVVHEYIEVLERQSVRLRKLIEDLIEASKASSGSLKVEKEPCELRIFLEQIAGEYEERLERANLTLNLSVPEKEVIVEADGRHLWRVIDNLLQNACKYAMSGTRVYLQLQVCEEQAMIVIKNVSASELNIPAEELMERFVRGDRSRHSEGSGLGLSIARSLTELQGGRFAIEIDGDLFKTAVGFPILKMDTQEIAQEEI